MYTEIPITDQHTVSLKRFDLMHPHFMGNKYYKLKYNIAKAKEQGHDTLASLGGAWSNHLHALAHVANEEGFKSIGLVRGRAEGFQSTMLEEVQDLGMHLHYLSREEYAEREENFFKAWVQDTFGRCYLIPEGGSNFLGMQGAMEMVSEEDKSNYDVLCVCAGTGATAAGIACSWQKPVHVFPCVDDESGIRELLLKHLNYAFFDPELSEEIFNRISIFSGYAFGGFGKKSAEVIDFIQDTIDQHGVELDLIYTAKMMMGIKDRFEKGVYTTDQRILAFHTGGVQGNRSINLSR